MLLTPIKLFILATTITLGSVHEEEGAVSHTFFLRNESADSIRINNVWTSCGCTTAEYDAIRWIGQGDSIPVNVKFVMRGKGGEFLETATVQIVSRNDTVNQTLSLEGEVIPSEESINRGFPVKIGNLRLSTDILDFGQMKRGESKTMNVGVYGHALVPVTFTADNGWGEQIITKEITVDGKKIKIKNKVLIIDNATGGQQIKTTRRLPSGSKLFSVTNTGSAPLVIHRVYTAKGNLISKDTTIAPNESREFTIPAACILKNEDTLIAIISNDPRNSRMTVRLLQ